MDTLNIPNLPHSLHWLNQPPRYDLSPRGSLTITAPAKTDWFIDPQGAVDISNAPALLFPTSGPCVLRAQVSVDHVATYDAGVLMVYESPQAWAKLCLELSPQGHPTVVSVVTKGVSDDCNAFAVTGPVYMRASQDWSKRTPSMFHEMERVGISSVTLNWKTSRMHRWDFEAQSPTGNGCRTTFSYIHFEERLIADIRSGE